MSAELGKGRVGAPVGQEPVGRVWRGFFWIAAVFNFAIGLSSMLAPASNTDGRIIGLLVFCFGILYLLVARDPRRFAPVLWAGVIGKAGVVSLLGPAAFGPDGDPLLAGVLAGDALFALGFLVFLFAKGETK